VSDFEAGTVEINRRAVERLRSGHLWIYRSDVTRLEDVRPGAVARIVDGRNWFVGKAFYSQTSEITLRLLTREDEAVDRAFFEARINAAIDLREHIFGKEVDAMRLVHSEGDLLPGLIVDRYQDLLVVQLLNQGTDRLREPFLEILSKRLSPRAIVLRNDAKVRSHEGLALKTEVAKGDASALVPYHEGALTFSVDAVGGQKTGAFLDQRENRIRVASYVRPGMDCLDCFTYGGGFALQMARAGGNVSALDISAEALASAKSSAAQNALQVDWIEANAFDWLKEQSLDGERFDLVVLDPPAFAKKKSKLEGAVRGYKEINLRAIQLLRKGGILVSCSCSYHLSESMLLELVLDAAQDAGRRVQLLEKLAAGRDHPVLMGVPETSYLKTLVFRLTS